MVEVAEWTHHHLLRLGHASTMSSRVPERGIVSGAREVRTVVAYSLPRCRRQRSIPALPRLVVPLLL